MGDGDEIARAFWIAGPGRGEIREERLPPPGPGEVLVRALMGGISRGTESLVFRGRVPESQHQAMRCPFQQGSFPGPVKYGYISVGRVENGPAALRDRRVFCLHPHQDRYRVPEDAVVPVPDDVPDRRAALAAGMETAVNALWDAAPRVGDRVAVVGGGVIGQLVAGLAVRVPGVRVVLVDTDPARADAATALGAGFAAPGEAEGGRDLVFHASGSPGGLDTALSLAGFEATVVELSWYGDAPVTAALGEGFHARRLRLVSSQVGAVAPARRARHDRTARMVLALELLREPLWDRLPGPALAFGQLPAAMAGLAEAPGDGRLPLVDYQAEGEGHV